MTDNPAGHPLNRHLFIADNLDCSARWTTKVHYSFTADSYLRLLLGTILGKDNFRNGIAWCTVKSRCCHEHPPGNEEGTLASLGENCHFNLTAYMPVY